jgi:splicing factor 4
MDKELFANDGSFMERFKQMQQEKDKAAAVAASSAPKHANPDPKPGFAAAANKRPFELKKAGPVAAGGKLAFSLKKAKVVVAPVFAADEEDEDAAKVEKEEPAKRHKSAQADAAVAAAPAGVVGNHLFIYYSFIYCCYNKNISGLPFLVFFVGVCGCSCH